MRPPAPPYFRKYLVSDPAYLRVITAFYEPDVDSSPDSRVTFLSTIANPAPNTLCCPQGEPGEHNQSKPCGKALPSTKPSGSLKVARSCKTEGNLHPLKYRLLAMRKEAEQGLLKSVRQRLPHYQWTLCLEPFDTLDRGSTVGHVSLHLQRSWRICLWSTCLQTVDSTEALRDHLSTTHGVPSVNSSLAAPAYCHDCREYFVNASHWSNHCLEHLANLDMFCGRIVRRGVIIVANRCIFLSGR